MPSNTPSGKVVNWLSVKSRACSPAKPSNTPSGKVVNWLMLNSSRCSPVRPEKSPARKAVNCFDSRSRLSTPASAWESTAAQSSASSAVKMESLTCSVRSHMLTVCAWAGSAAAASKRASSVLIRFILGCKSIGAVAGGQRQAFGSSARGHASKRPSTALQRQPLLPITLYSPNGIGHRNTASGLAVDGRIVAGKSGRSRWPASSRRRREGRGVVKRPPTAVLWSGPRGLGRGFAKTGGGPALCRTRVRGGGGGQVWRGGCGWRFAAPRTRHGEQWPCAQAHLRHSPTPRLHSCGNSLQS